MTTHSQTFVLKLNNMKKISALFILFLATINYVGAVDYISAGSGEWTNTATWSPNGSPGYNDNITIKAGHNITLNQDVTVNSIIIEAGGKLEEDAIARRLIIKNTSTVYGVLISTNIEIGDSWAPGATGPLIIAPGGVVKVTGTLETYGNSNRLIIKTNPTTSGSLINSSEVAATIEFYIGGSANHLITPFFDGITANAYYDPNNDAWLSSHDESTNNWSYITDLTAGLNKGQGYSYWPTNATTLTFAGTLSTSDVTKSISNNGQAWNLLGNPFSSAIDWDNASWTHANSTGTVYVYDNSHSGDNGYLTWNGTTGTLGNGIIPMGQGFFVKANGTGNFTIPADARIADNKKLYKSKNDTDPTMYVRFDLNDSNVNRALFIGFPENGTDQFDFAGDADLLYSSSDKPEIYTIENEKELCINANTPLEEGETRTIPLYLVQIIDGSYTLTLSDLDQLPDTKITLEDLQTGTIQNMNNNPVYTFTAYNGDEPNRFRVHFTSSPNSVNESDAVNNDIQIYSYGKEVYIRSTNDAVHQNGIVYVYDLMGRKLTEKKIAGSNLVNFTVNTNNNYVVIKVVKESSVKTQKVFIK